MLRKVVPVALLACIAIACSKDNKNSDTNITEKPADTVSVQITGSVNSNFTAIGEDQVGIGYTKFTKTGFENFALTAINEANGVSYDISSGSLPLKLTTGEVVYDGALAVGGSARIITDANTDDYNGGTYYLFFDTDENMANSKVYMNLESITDVGQFIRMKGKYHYNGGAAPNQLSDPCIMDAIANAGRQPGYNANLCGAKEVKVAASFVIYVDKITQQP
ncbi:hypothetical protein SAMN05444266_10966 [Chitinophaga jiangningensis]|uniref:Lipoprotein n=1 Tax=Chitinophaga jiangningensis TaxID=1419482 RepID=A0A1M7JYT3_9BACT|nr:hypothetical protein [Chitinophaga jiangningensis]SHM57883.1 hypothetical protein SAMN05444266_10966 [Chitinophaga jiangningensis]